jgi:hypothetical protein
MAAFPEFQPLELRDRDSIRKALWDYQPETSELTFTNLFVWSSYYGWRWSKAGPWLLLLQDKEGRKPSFLPPIGPSPRIEITRSALEWLRQERGVARPAIERADPRLASEVGPEPRLVTSPQREHFDYVYRTSDLIALKGSKYHAKRNHISRFLEEHGRDFRFVPIGPDNLGLCAEFQDRWCERRRCDEDMNLLEEGTAIRLGLTHYQDLDVRGGAVLVDGSVEGFTFGELLNPQTAVVHIEKANPEIPGLYALVNQAFCREYWSGVPSVNREQDLGEEGLRKAKLSYHPARLVEKFRVELAD